ncbi:hypothetical protein OAT93_00590 [bacterium]|nr:hypothetical protein [bacterium]
MKVPNEGFEGDTRVIRGSEGGWQLIAESGRYQHPSFRTFYIHSIEVTMRSISHA